MRTTRVSQESRSWVYCATEKEDQFHNKTPMSVVRVKQLMHYFVAESRLILKRTTLDGAKFSCQ